MKKINRKLLNSLLNQVFKIKILGSADNLKPRDQYQVAKSKALVEPQQSATPTNTITSDEEDQNPDQPEAGTEQQPSTQPKQ